MESSSGNVYRDLGFPAAEAEYLLLRSRLMIMVAEVIRQRGLTQVAAATLLGVSQPRVSDVVRGRFERFTIDALVEMLARAGLRLDIVPLEGAGFERRELLQEEVLRTVERFKASDRLTRDEVYNRNSLRVRS